MELALWCDLRVMEESAYMGVYCRRWGVPLIDGGTVRLPRIVGRGTALDPFNRTEERKTERALPAAYETMLAEVLAALAPHNHKLAVELAEIPEHIRGYGHVKERHLKAAKAKEAELLSAFRRATPVGPKTVALAAD